MSSTDIDIYDDDKISITAEHRSGEVRFYVSDNNAADSDLSEPLTGQPLTLAAIAATIAALQYIRSNYLEEDEGAGD